MVGWWVALEAVGWAGRGKDVSSATTAARVWLDQLVADDCEALVASFDAHAVEALSVVGRTRLCENVVRAATDQEDVVFVRAEVLETVLHDAHTAYVLYQAHLSAGAGAGWDAPGALRVVRGDDGWRVAPRNGDPPSAEKVRELLQLLPGVALPPPAGDPAPDAVPVAFVVREVAPGQRVLPADVVAVPLSAASLPGGVVRDLDDAIGRVAVARLIPGEPVRVERLASPDVGDGPAALLAPGHQAMAVTAASTPYRVGDRVDLVSVWADDACVVAQDLRILAVGSGNPVVEVPLAQVGAVTRAAAGGWMALAARGPGDRGSVASACRR